jgi:hypothetical protein
MLEQVASHLCTLLDEVVFVGGAVTSLLITDPAATEVRFTQDVDMIVQVTSHADYYNQNQSHVVCGHKKKPLGDCHLEAFL